MFGRFSVRKKQKRDPEIANAIARRSKRPKQSREEKKEKKEGSAVAVVCVMQ